jgi:predicted ABC-type ATPase
LPTLLVIAGPNGAGKTTFAAEYLAADQRPFAFVNADEIARGLPHASDVQAARLMLRRMSELIDENADLAIETTLASLGYAKKIPAWRRRGYVVSLVYLRLDSVEQSIARVRKRVAAGGHSIPEQTIRRRFDKSWRYFSDIYRPLVDEWYVWESREGGFVMAESWDGQYAPRA